MKDQFNLHGSAKGTSVHNEGSTGKSCCARSIFSMKLAGFMSKAIKLLLTELIGQCRNILPLAFSTLTSLQSVNTEKETGYIFLH